MSEALQPNDIVLVVDDSPEALSLINDALEAQGLDVLVALEGRQALTIAKRIRPDIILLDAMMPHMDGFETCQKLKEDVALSSIPVIFMTGLSDTRDIIKGLEVGGVDYLTKPINPEELIARMKVHLHNARIANSAQSALDSAGQQVLTMATDGVVRWATPQTYALLARANATPDWQTKHMAPQVAKWLGHNPQLQNTLPLTGLDYKLALKLVSQQDDGVFLFRLLDGERPTGASLLKEKLLLTERESEVLYWLSNGKTNREIAQILEMSPRTVNKHLEQIFPKLDVDNRTSAAGVALKVLAVDDL
ncbi:MAG: response regulator [Pontibacterium sp.]